MTYDITATQNFNDWFDNLKDVVARRKILARLERAKNGHFGDVKAIDARLFEMRFFFGGGYRVYYSLRDNEIIILLCGGNKATQTRDITKAKTILNELE